MFGQEETSSFWGHWESVKNKIKELVALPGNIEQRKAEIILLQKKAEKAKDWKKYDMLEAKLWKMVKWTPTAKKVAKLIQDYGPTWASAASPSAKTLGFVPVVIGVAALGALAYVATFGLSLLKEYKQEEGVIASLVKKELTIEEAKGLIKAGKKAPLIEAGIGLGLGVLPLVLVGGAALFLFGMPKRS